MVGAVGRGAGGGAGGFLLEGGIPFCDGLRVIDPCGFEFAEFDFILEPHFLHFYIKANDHPAFSLQILEHASFRVNLVA